MKTSPRFLLTLLGATLLACPVPAQAYEVTYGPMLPKREDPPKYLLIVQRAESNMITSIPVRDSHVGSSFDYTYHEHPELYDTLREVYKRVNRGPWNSPHVVGLWDLRNAKRLKIETWQTVEKIPERVEEREVEHKHWSIEGYTPEETSE